MAETANVRQEIERIGREFSAAYNRGDAAGVAALYAEDARLMPPGHAAITGRAAIQAFWQGARESGLGQVTLRTEEVAASGDLAYEVGSAAIQAQTPDGQAVADTLKYLVVWKRHTSGAWQLAVDIWNTNG